MDKIIEGLNDWFRKKYPESGFFLYNSVTEKNKIAPMFKTMELTIYYAYKDYKYPVRVFTISFSYRNEGPEEKYITIVKEQMETQLTTALFENYELINNIGKTHKVTTNETV